MKGQGWRGWRAWVPPPSTVARAGGLTSGRIRDTRSSMPDERIALYTRLFESHRTALRNFLLKRYRGDFGGEIEDVLQETWLQGRNTFPPRSATFKTWITTCAISAANNRLRKAKRRLPMWN